MLRDVDEQTVHDWQCCETVNTPLDHGLDAKLVEVVCKNKRLDGHLTSSFDAPDNLCALPSQNR
jgi:hypothetical protein